MIINQNIIAKYIESQYEGVVRSKVRQLESIMGFTYLQELKIVSSFKGELEDIILIFGDLENFSYKSIKNMIFELTLYSKLFGFNGIDYIVNILKNLSTNMSSPGMDQYVGVSLISGKIVEYYAIIGGVKHELDKVSINFNTDLTQKLKGEFPSITDISSGTPGNIHIEFNKEGSIRKKTIHYYDSSSVTFLRHIKEINPQIKNPFIKDYVNMFQSINNKNYWADFICWNGYNNDNGNEVEYLTLEFFLGKSQKYFSHFPLQALGFTPYICQLYRETLTVWLLAEESFTRRKKNGYYKKYGIV